MPQDYRDSIDQQGQFYRNNFRRLLGIAYVWVTICLCLTFFILYQFFNTPAPYYFATTINGQMSKMVAK